MTNSANSPLDMSQFTVSTFAHAIAQIISGRVESVKGQDRYYVKGVGMTFHVGFDYVDEVVYLSGTAWATNGKMAELKPKSVTNRNTGTARVSRWIRRHVKKTPVWAGQNW